MKNPIIKPPMTFSESIEIARSSHLLKGYTYEHDKEKGLDELLKESLNYANNGEFIKAMSIVVAARDLITMTELQNGNQDV